jgi:hypothetical protein
MHGQPILLLLLQQAHNHPGKQQPLVMPWLYSDNNS